MDTIEKSLLCLHVGRRREKKKYGKLWSEPIRYLIFSQMSACSDSVRMCAYVSVCVSLEMYACIILYLRQTNLDMLRTYV